MHYMSSCIGSTHDRISKDRVEAAGTQDIRWPGSSLHRQPVDVSL